MANINIGKFKKLLVCDVDDFSGLLWTLVRMKISYWGNPCFVGENAENGIPLWLYNYPTEEGYFYTYLLHSLKASSNKSLNRISVSSVNYNETNDTFNVIVEVHEKPQLTVLFHGMVFKKINNEWILVSFSQDA